MGIHGIFKEIGPGQRISLAKVSADHYINNNRPFRLAIDISIWLFQIQAGKGGSNPALRTFYYRLLRLLSLNIHPLFVFDGPNKPQFKRNKRVGGPGVRVATVPEYLAKQLLGHFGFPMHFAPGEAEAECALLQREGIVDAVLSEDVDTLMFGSNVTLKNWTSENTTKSPTHVNLYRAEQTKESSGLDREGMVLVALMSGGDYIPEGIPGCGPKVACDAARAGFGRDLCALGRKDAEALRSWKERLQHEIRTNECKFFTRKSKTLVIPDDFPNAEVLGYYTHPCVSTPEKLQRLGDTLTWDRDIDFVQLRNFAAEAFDWRYLGGAKKFIKNLAPAMLVRRLRLSSHLLVDNEDLQQGREEGLISAIHGKRNHATTDGSLEYRVSFTPARFVPIDLSVEEEDDQFIPAGGENESDAENGGEDGQPRNALQNSQDDMAPPSPTKSRNFRPYDPKCAEKIWIMKDFLQLGCPLLLEDYEASFTDPRKFLEQRWKAKEISKQRGATSRKSRNPRQVPNVQENTLLKYARITKAVNNCAREVLKELSPYEANVPSSQPVTRDEISKTAQVLKFPSSQIPKDSLPSFPRINAQRDADSRSLESQEKQSETISNVGGETSEVQERPRRKKRRSSNSCPPAESQTSMLDSVVRTPQANRERDIEVVDLCSSPSSPRLRRPRPSTPSPMPVRLTESSDSVPDTLPPLPNTVTKRSRKGQLKRSHTAPARGSNEMDAVEGAAEVLREPNSPLSSSPRSYEARSRSANHLFLDPVDSSPAGSPCSLPSPVIILRRNVNNPSAIQNSIPTEPAQGESSTQTVINSIHLPISVPSSSPASFRAAPLLEKSTSLDNTADCSTNTAATLYQPKPIQESHPRAPKPRKVQIQLRESLAGTWKEVPRDAEELDLTGDGSGWKASKGRAALVGSREAEDGSASGTRWRRSGVEILDLTGA